VIRFEAEALMPIDPETAFDLALSIDAHLGAFADAGEQAVDGVTSGLIGLGEFVTWRARHFGITWTMTSAITAWDRPHRFVDEQRKGPFTSFRHEHLFEPVEHGTRLRDRVEFEAPFGVVGRLVEKLVLDRYLRHLIDVRNTFLVTEATKLGPTTRSEHHG